MSRYSLTKALVLILLTFVVGKSYACNRPPTAVIALPDPKWAHINNDIGLDGKDSYDNDGWITNWDWDIDGDGDYDCEGEEVAVRYSSTGTYTLRLRVRDDKGAYGYDTCTVYVVSIGITMAPGESSYVAVNNDDDNENGIMDMCEGGQVSGENDLRRVLLSVITPKPTDKAHLSLGPEGEPQMQVWSKADRQGLLLSIKDGPTYVEWPSGNVPTEVYIEASSYSGPVDNKSLWLGYTGVDYNTIPTSVYPVYRTPPAKIDFTCV